MEYTIVIDGFRKKFEEIRTTLENVLNQLNDDQVNWRPNAFSNSVGNLIIHIAGNIHQRFGHGILGHEDIRDRDAEFDIHSSRSAGELVVLLHHSFGLLRLVLNDLTEEAMLDIQLVRGKPRSNVEVLMQATAHYSEHLGQIIYIAKQILGEQFVTVSIDPRKRV